MKKEEKKLINFWHQEKKFCLGVDSAFLMQNRRAGGSM